MADFTLSSTDLEELRNVVGAQATCARKLEAAVDELVRAQQSGDDAAISRALLDFIANVYVTSAAQESVTEVVRQMLPADHPGNPGSDEAP